MLLYQGVTLGGTGKEHGKRHPTLAENVVVGAGAGWWCRLDRYQHRIGAGSVVVRDVSDCTVVGIPGRVIRERRTDQSPRPFGRECGSKRDPQLDGTD